MSSQQLSLCDARILVTRPRHQAEALCHMIEEQGGIALRFPTLEIQPLIRNTAAGDPLEVGSYNWLIFVSVNAVNFAFKSNNVRITDLLSPQIAAVGRATAQALKDQGLNVDLLPEQGYDSEALLASRALQDLDGKRCLLVRGRGGREILADTLRQRGAQVDYLEVYQRVIPESDVSELLDLLQHKQIFAVTITSAEALQNLITMLGRHAPALLQVPLVVVSDRIRQIAATMGFRRISVADSPADITILKTLMMLHGENSGRRN